MAKLEWFQREFKFGVPAGMLPFYLERLEGTIVRLEKKINGIGEKILSTKLNDKWSVKENIGHLAEVDEIANKRIDEMKAGVSPMSPAVFPTKQDYNALTAASVLEYFKTNRLANLRKYKALSDADLSKASLHPRLKIQMTPVDLALFDAEHDDHHLVTINEILNQLG